jgi:diguanylate cyclase (GGDEF)-like protein
MHRLNSLGVRARLALGIGPLIVLMAAVALIVDLGFNSVGETTTTFEISAKEAEYFETMERCLASSQRALLRYMVNRSEVSIAAFDANVQCMIELARQVAPGLLGSLNHYQDSFDAVVQLTLQEIDLRDKAMSYGPLALQTLTSIIRSEARAGNLETTVIAAAMKDKIAESLFLLDRFLKAETEASALELVTRAIQRQEDLMSALSSPLQRQRAEATIGLLENYLGRVSEAKAAIHERSLLERHMLEVIAPRVAESITFKTTRTQDRRQTLGEAIGITLDRTHQRVLLLTAIALTSAILVVLLIGTWVSNAVRKMARLMSRIASGEFEIDVPGTEWSNEFGEMARSLETFQNNTRRRIEAEIEAKAARAAAETDPVTGLGNRRAIDRRVSIMSEEQGHASSVALIDLNAFKPINDNFGHDAGDLVLKVIGQRLADAFQETGFVSRLGGDEFGVLLELQSETEDLQRAGKCLLEVFEDTIDYGREALRVGASIGIARLADVDGDPDAAWKAADRAMFTIKAKRVNGFAIFDPEDVEETADAFPAARIAEGLANGEFVPFFQPKFELDTGDVVGFEALARWRHPEEGVLAPRQFLESIEKFGLINEFTQNIVTDATKCIRLWRDAGLDPPPVAINLHEVFIAAEGGVESLLEILRTHDVDPFDVVLEVTENVLISRGHKDAKRAIYQLSEHGFRISLDDFGTGFGSLRHLEELPVNEVKIDKGFVDRIGVSRDSEAIISCVINLAKGLNIDVVAEGVDNSDQLAFLAEHGCKIAQGFLKSPAIDQNEVREMLAFERAYQSSDAPGIAV